MGSINHSHAFKHEEGIKSACRRKCGAEIGTDGAQFADEGISLKGTGEEEAASEVSVPGPERGADPNTAEVVKIATGRVQDPIKRETRSSKKATPKAAGPAGTTTAHACGRPAE
jgi:hypothetical protein